MKPDTTIVFRLGCAESFAEVFEYADTERARKEWQEKHGALPDDLDPEDELSAHTYNAEDVARAYGIIRD